MTAPPVINMGEGESPLAPIEPLCFHGSLLGGVEPRHAGHRPGTTSRGSSLSEGFGGKLLAVADDVLFHTRAILPHTSVDSLDRRFF